MLQQTLDIADKILVKLTIRTLVRPTAAIAISIYSVDIEPNKDQKGPYST
jgi:hypothetical protein